MPDFDRFNDNASRYTDRPMPKYNEFERSVLYEQLEEARLKCGPVYATGVLKGKTVKQAAADFRAQETIRADTARILGEADG